MISGRALVFVLIGLAVWFLLLCGVLWKWFRTRRVAGPRGYLTQAGLCCAAIAVASLLALHVSWLSADISQHLGVRAIRLVGFLLFYPTVAGLTLSAIGSGRIRFLGLGTCLVTGCWWFSLAAVAGLSGAPLVRHSTRFLIPKSYVGWVEIEYRTSAPPLPMTDGKYICKIPKDGFLATSSALEDGWASDEYFYYSQDGGAEVLPNTGWGGGGMIWAGSVGTDPSKPGKFTQRFYVGKEDQYRRNDSSAN